MFDSDQLAIVRQGVTQWNSWRAENPRIAPNLSTADLSGLSLVASNLTAVDLSEANLSDSDLDNAVLTGANLQSANLEGVRGLKRIARSGARNVILARYSPDVLAELKLPVDHNQRLRDKNLVNYKCPGFDFRGAKLSDFDLSKTVLTDCILTDADLSGSKLIGADLRWSRLDRADLTKCDLNDALLTYCNLREARLRWAILRGAQIDLADFSNTDFLFADLRNSIFFWRGAEPDILRSKNYIFAYVGSSLADALNLRPQAATPAPPSGTDSQGWRHERDSTHGGQDSDHNRRLNGKSLAGYDLTGYKLDDLDLKGWDLSEACFKRASLRRANLSGCKLDGAILTDAILDEAQLSGATLDGALLQRASLCKTDLRNVKLVKARLDAATLKESNFENADLSGSDLPGIESANAIFRGANLSGCNLSEGVLQLADFTEARLDEADLSDAVLVSAKLVRARLCKAKARGADFANADLERANVQNADFRCSKGLTSLAIMRASNYRLAFYDVELLNQLNFPNLAEHNDRLASNDFSNQDFSGCDLSGADFGGMNLEMAKLAGSKLDGARLERARLGKTVLDRASLKNAELQHADLTSASLKEARLDGSCAEYAILVNADLRMASLVNVSLRNANVTSATFRDAILAGVDLQEAQGLYSDQLAATDINNAKLPPELGEFSALKNIEGITISARGLVLTMVLLCAYATIQVAALMDGDMIANRNILSSPVLEMRAPVLFFCFGCPMLLFAVFLWAHFYLQHLWEELSQLPAIFQDSRPLYKRVYPWFLNTFVSAHFPILRKDRPLMTHVQIICSVAITWWMVPATIFLLWAKYLGVHDWYGTRIQLTLLSISIAVAAFLQNLAGATLRGEKRRPLRIYRPSAKQIKISALVMLLLICLLFYSLGAINGCAINGTTGSWFALQMAHLESGRCVAADLMGAELSTKGSGWKGDDEALVTGAKLEGRNLQRAKAQQAFLARADLRHADLQEADFSNADFRWADLSGANLKEANLVGARFEHTRLVGAHLEHANLTGAHLSGADLRGAYLRNVIGLTKEQLDVAIMDRRSK